MKTSGTNILLILVAILLVGGSFVFAEYRNKQAEDIYQAKDLTASTNDITTAPQEVDTDGDGSKDWEEILVGTNPNDPKSKPSTTKSSATTDLTATPPEKLSQIDLVSRDFFARYMELRQLGASKDKASQEELARTTAGNISLSKPADYSIDEILTKSDTSNAAVIQYGNEISAIFKKYAIQSRNEAVITKESLDKEDPEILKEIDPIILSYKNIINSLIKVAAPQSMATMHLDLVNAMNGSLFVAQSLRNSDADAIKGVQAVVYYQVVSQQLYNAFSAIKSYFKYLGINENIF